MVKVSTPAVDLRPSRIVLGITSYTLHCYQWGYDMGTDNLVAYNSPEEYVAAMRAALWDANRPEAIRLAKLAIKHFPEHEEVHAF